MGWLVWCFWSFRFAVGGIIIEHLGWQAIFYVVLPILVLAIFIIPKEKSRNEALNREINWYAMLGIFIGIFLLIFNLIDGNQNSWESITSYIRLFISILFFLIIILWQNRMNQPLIPLRIFKRVELLGASLGTFFIYFSLNGIYIFLVFHFQTFYNYSPTQAGWAMLHASVMVTLFAARFGKLGNAMGDWKVLRIGALLATFAFIGLLFPGKEANYLFHFFPFIFLLGLGMSLFVAPLTTFALKASPDEIGLASGVNNLIARFSGVLAIGIIGGIFAIVEDGLEKFRISTMIMTISSALGATFIIVLIPRNGDKLKRN